MSGRGGSGRDGIAPKCFSASFITSSGVVSPDTTSTALFGA